MEIKWTHPPHDGGTPIDHYQVFRLDPMGDPVIVDTTGSECLKTSDSNLIRGRYYGYYVLAVNGLGRSRNSETVYGRLLDLPLEPVNLTGFQTGDRIFLRWDPPVHDGGSKISSYIVYRITDNRTLEFTTEVDPDNTLYLDDNVRPGHTYRYYLKAKNEVGEGDFSEGVTLTLNTTAAFSEESTGKTVTIVLWAILALLIVIIMITFVRKCFKNDHNTRQPFAHYGNEWEE